MADYKKMYYTLCKAAEEVIEPLAKIPGAHVYAELLHSAMLKAEEIYVDTSADEPEKN